MRNSHTIYSCGAVAVSLIYGLNTFLTLVLDSRDGGLLWMGAVFLLTAGGLVNLLERRLELWPTVAIIAGYFLSVLLSPLAIWGIVLLILQKRRSRRHRQYLGLR